MAKPVLPSRSRRPPHAPIAPSPRFTEWRVADFHAEAWADAAELQASLEGLPHDQLQQVFDRAAACLDLKRLALAGAVLLRQGHLRRDGIYLLARALSAQGRHAEAADLLRRPIAMRSLRFRHVQQRARALAAAGALREALAAVDEAIAAHPEFALETLRRQLARTCELEARQAALTTGGGILELARAYLELGLEGRAAELLGRTMSKPPAEFGLTVADQLELIALALRAGSADPALAYIAAFPDNLRNDERWRASAVAAATLAGRPDRTAAPGPAAEGDSPSLRFWGAMACEAQGEPGVAAGRLCALDQDFKGDGAIRRAIAKCVGESVLAQVRPSFAPGRTGRIVNVMPFFNELDLLRLHLEEMSPWVDHFVIVEGAKTFTGRDRSLTFEANRSLFRDFEAKIVYVPVRTFPANLTSPWGREFYQRDMGIAGASGLCGEEDYIVETDLDEIIDGRALEGFEADFAGLELKLSRFFLNYRPTGASPEHARAKSTIFKARHRARHGLSYCRLVLAGSYREAHLVRDAGWHFTSAFDAAGISLKVNSYSHQEQDKPEFRTQSHFQTILDRLRRGQFDPGWERAEIDDSFPGCVRRNREAFARLIL